MEVDFQRFQQFLAKKNRKVPSSRPLTSLPHPHIRHLSNLQPRQLGQFRRPENTGGTVRLSSIEKRTYRQMQSNSICDPLYSQGRVFKLKVGNTCGVRQLVLRDKKSSNNSIFKEAINDKLRDWSKKEAENERTHYQAKKLRVVKGKGNVYRQKLRNVERVDKGGSFLTEEVAKNVSIIGTKML